MTVSELKQHVDAAYQVDPNAEVVMLGVKTTIENNDGAAVHSMMSFFPIEEIRFVSVGLTSGPKRLEIL